MCISNGIDRNVSFYDSTAAEYDNLLSRVPGDLWVREAFHDLVLRSVHPGSLLLDFGCGTGTDAAWYAHRGYRVLAYDYSSGMMRQLRRKCAQEVDRGIIVPMEGSWSSFMKLCEPQPRPAAIVANFAVLNSIRDLRSLFDLLAGIVDPSGWVIVSVLNPHFWKAHISWRKPHRRHSRASASALDMDTYMHSIGEISAAAAPNFALALRASVAFLIRYNVGIHDWWKPRSASERMERQLWRNSLCSRLGKFLFMGFRVVGTP
jgi:SAM-dependent methyltransferase